jgi:hypothetical protein
VRIACFILYLLVFFDIIFVKVYDSLTPWDVRIAYIMGRREYIEDDVWLICVLFNYTLKSLPLLSAIDCPLFPN